MRQANIFYAVITAKRFQTRTEEEIEQLLSNYKLQLYKYHVFLILVTFPKS